MPTVYNKEKPYIDLEQPTASDVFKFWNRIITYEIAQFRLYW